MHAKGAWHLGPWLENGWQPSCDGFGLFLDSLTIPRQIIGDIVAKFDEVKENDYNLNVTLYVFPQEKIEEIDISEEFNELRNLEKEIIGIENKLESYLREIK